MVGAISLEVMAPAILMVLSFVVWAALANRQDLAEVAVSMQQMHGSGRILRFANYPDPGLRDHLRGAKDIDLSGLNFHRFFPLYLPDVEHALRNGARLRVIITDPDGAAMDMASFGSENRVDTETERSRVQATINLLRNQQERRPETDLELRKCSYLAPYALAVVRPKDPDRDYYYHARVLPFRSSSMKAPTIVPETGDRDWIDFIEHQFENLWEASTRVDLDSRESGASTDDQQNTF